MKNNKSKLSLLSETKKREAIEVIIAFYKRERGEQIGVIAAEEILDLVVEVVGVEIFNKGVAEATRLVQDRMAGIWVDVEATVKRG